MWSSSRYARACTWTRMLHRRGDARDAHRTHVDKHVSVSVNMDAMEADRAVDLRRSIIREICTYKIKYLVEALHTKIR